MFFRGTLGNFFSVGAMVMFAVLAGGVKAETMTSTNYRVQNDVLSIGGGNSSSTNYFANDALGELATGEDLTSTNYKACAGFECFGEAPYITFDVRSGLSDPGTPGGSIDFGLLTTGAVKTSDHSAIKSVFLDVSTNAPGGVVVQAHDLYNGVRSLSQPLALIDSVTATLVAGTEGFGIWVFSNTQDGGSPTAFSKQSPYNGTCNTSTGHAVGPVNTTPATVLSSTGPVIDGAAEVLVKAAIGATTGAASDYQDTITFIATATF